MQDNVIPQGKWVFDEKVTNCFENMIERCIPNYDTIRKLVFDLGCCFVKEGTEIIDLGCSTGIGIKPFIDKYGAHNHFTLIDSSKPMIDKCNKEYSGYIRTNIIDVECLDLKNGIKKRNTSLILSFLTLQFVPMEYRAKLLSDIYNALNYGGAFILIEKLISDSNKINNIYLDKYYLHKIENGYTQNEITTKRKSLEGVLVPLTSKWNEDFLRSQGFSHVECFWRWLNFGGFIAVK